MTSFEGPSFDLGIDDEPEDLSLLIVEDSLDKNEDSNQDQDVMFGDEVMSYDAFVGHVWLLVERE